LIIILSTQFGYCQNSIEIDFSNTEWMSDSLVIVDEKQWREFIFFDSAGNFTRATWWNRNYILDKGELNGEIVHGIKNDYRIEIIDSFNIKIYKPNYVGFFYGNPWRINEDFTRSLNRFVVGDSIKKRIVGNWEYESHELKLAEHLSFYEEIPDFAEDKLSRIGGLKIENKLSLKITESNEFIVADSIGNTIEYRYIIDDDEISIRRSDYIIGLEYEIDESGDLIIINKPRVGKARILMKRK